MSPIPGIIASQMSGHLSTTSFESIATVAGTGSATTITFSNIPSGYQHLQIRYIGKATGSSADSYLFTIRFNGDTGSNYARHAINGSGAAVAASGAATQTAISSIYNVIPNSATALANMHGVGVIDIHNYLSTSNNKTVRIVSGVDLNRTTAPTGSMNISSGLWFKTPEAITSIDIISGTNNWTTTSSFALYGIKG